LMVVSTAYAARRFVALGPRLACGERADENDADA
jgi:hypothetical protein